MTGQTVELKRPERVVEHSPGLTHSLDQTKEGLAMDATRICVIPDCGKALNAHSARGLCGTHYQAARRANRLDDHARVAPKFRSVEDRFFSKVDATGICWEWTATVATSGYGKFGRGSRGTGEAYAHRWSYEYLVGPIPDELTIDHLCRNRLCVNPDHLEVVTRAENARRAHPRADYCALRGHSKADAYSRPDGKGRECRECRRERLPARAAA